MEIQFLGATGTVTGSKYLVTTNAKQVLVDCGLFQGFKQLRLRNWAKLPFDPREIDAVILTHAHLDHSGYLPLLVKNGFKGRIYCSKPTLDLCEILLPDSGRLQEEEAGYANRHGFSKHKPALPLYTQEDGERAMRYFAPVPFEREIDLGNDLRFRLLPSGHILGSALVRLDNGSASLLFSGDLGRPNDPILKPPVLVKQTDFLVLESTYGDRLHDASDPQRALAAIINRTAKQGGVVVIPAFAVGRAQTVMYHVHQLRLAGAIPDIPIYLDSPMAVRATRVLYDHPNEHRLSPGECETMCGEVRVAESVEDSKRLSAMREPMVLISASGMATGGRVLHHLKAFAADARNTILFTGFQAGGTRGANMLAGAEAVKIHGEYVPIRAHVTVINNLSAHADYKEILDWLGGFESPPYQTFITHGEATAADALRHRIEEQLGWSVTVPEYLESVSLT